MSRKERAPGQVMLPGAINSKPLPLDLAGVFVLDITSARPTRQPHHEICQWCGRPRPVAWWIPITYQEEGERHAWAGLCAECRDLWQARIERNRARRRWRG